MMVGGASSSAQEGHAPAPACPVCCEAYTNDKRRPIAWPGCEYAACGACVKAFLLSSASDPCCMNCGLFWNRGFLDSNLTAAWRNGPLRKHREHVLLDRERSLLPATQLLVEAEVHRRAEAQRRHDLYTAMKEAKRAYDACRAAYLNRSAPLREDAGPQAPPTEKRAFVAACPDADCRGFLSTQPRCGTCLTRFCAACREPKADQDSHVCDPGTVATMALIASHCRACPSCGTAISRVSGCDHMWCTSCDTGFSYATGQPIADRTNTNPHFYERMRQLQARCTASEAEPRAAWPLPSFCYSPLCGSKQGFLLSMYQCGRHVETIELPRIPSDRGDFTALRVCYCLGDFDEKQFGAKLQQLEKRREFGLEKRQVLETFVLLAFEFVSGMAASLNSPGFAETCSERCDAFVTRVQELVNEPLQILSDRYGVVTPRILTEMPLAVVRPTFSEGPQRWRVMDDGSGAQAMSLWLPNGHSPRKPGRKRPADEEEVASEGEAASSEAGRVPQYRVAGRRGRAREWSGRYSFGANL